MLSNFIFWIIPILYSIYLYSVIYIFKLVYELRIDDVRVLLDRFLILGLFGLMIGSLLAYFGLKSRLELKKVLLIPGVCAVILVIVYYFFVPTAIEMSAWMDIPGINI